MTSSNSEDPFGHLIATDTPENIYYADLFCINDKNWMILGYGKSNAARIATNKIHALDMARDAVAIIRKDDELFARYDPGALSETDSELNALYKLDAIAYCLNEEQTIKAFDSVDDDREIADAGVEVLAALCATYMYPAYLAPHFFSQAEFKYFSSAKRMRERFVELTKNTKGTAFLLVPHMPKVEEKAALYTNCDLAQLAAQIEG